MAEGGEDTAVVTEFLDAVKGRTGPDIQAAVPGITQSDVSRWRRHGVEWLSEPKRHALVGFLERYRAGERIFADDGDELSIEEKAAAFDDLARVVALIVGRTTPVYVIGPRKEAEEGPEPLPEVAPPTPATPDRIAKDLVARGGSDAPGRPERKSGKAEGPPSARTDRHHRGRNKE